MQYFDDVLVSEQKGLIKLQNRNGKEYVFKATKVLRVDSGKYQTRTGSEYQSDSDTGFLGGLVLNALFSTVRYHDHLFIELNVNGQWFRVNDVEIHKIQLLNKVVEKAQKIKKQQDSSFV